MKKNILVILFSLGIILFLRSSNVSAAYPACPSSDCAVHSCTAIGGTCVYSCHPDRVHGDCRFTCTPHCPSGYTDGACPAGTPNCQELAGGASCNECGNITACHRILAPPNTPVPPPNTPVPPGCGTDCSRDASICARTTDGCSACIQNGSSRTCQQPPSACRYCSSDQECQQRPGCGNACNTTTGCYTRPTDTPIPTGTPRPECGFACPSVGQCPSSCPCSNGICTQPTLTPRPTAGACVEGSTPPDPSDPNFPGPDTSGRGSSCASDGDCGGGWCFGYTTGSACACCGPNCHGGGPPKDCHEGDGCEPRRGIPVDKDGYKCYSLHINTVPARCCSHQETGGWSPWTIRSCGDVNTPTPVPPTATNTPSPTPVQPTQEISMIPTPTTNLTRTPTTPVTPGATRAPAQGRAQRWVCLQALPCSDSASHCSGQGTPDHRVKLSMKTNPSDPAKPLGGKPTYIFECLQIGTTHKCTTGNETLDRAALGTSNYQALHAAPYGYNFGGMYYANGTSTAPNPIPAADNNNGDFGVREWESHTTQNINRLFLAMNQLELNGTGGDVGAQQQATLAFLQGGSKKCVQIKWDPSGQVVNKWTLKSVPEAQVYLFKKTTDGEYSMVSNSDVMGDIQNPTYTDQQGNYNFLVPDGIYKIEVKVPGYEIYKGNDIVQKDGKTEEHNVKLQPRGSSILERVENFLKAIIHN